MRSPRVSSPCLFRAAAAVTAAAAVDPLVERMSNAGFFGPGRYTDHSNVDVLPALCVGLVLSTLLLVLLVRRMLAQSSHPPEWLRACALDLRSRSIWRMLPSIFVIQMSVLFGMETLEQFVVTGHSLGGTVWLGGPVLISALLHFAGCVFGTLALSRLLRWSARAIVRSVRVAFEILQKLLQPAAMPSSSARSSAFRLFIEPFLRGQHGRAPPILSVVNP